MSLVLSIKYKSKMSQITQGRSLGDCCKAGSRHSGDQGRSRNREMRPIDEEESKRSESFGGYGADEE